ncbi:type VI secretion system lipoprotein TssJ [Sansalvadorimonas sp. 2012CJ34-2]|uniref:Type VI secretion system lipoprotein TssJ n=1 Tax=Parendozoicomonas callyspongiae TaxID=2942213 RepID=A0ABT0PJE2_9GAMM|nr:type VI secretion system lipoprotein TssJ [Sansalvadorimonas sp. 2012CJ34-2]MCL6271091.1 type VI secretion system lipoprotein TssJ [Sansalvadorimonas sp. 2012CJ34-2]
MLKSSPVHRGVMSLMLPLVLILSLAMGGCSFFGGDKKKAGDDETPVLSGIVALTVRVADFVNPDIYGRPCPVEVRLYEVEDCQTFRQQRFLDLYNQADRFLGAQLLKTHELYSLKPGQTLNMNLPIIKGTKCLAALAGYSQFRDGSPTSTLAISGSENVRLTLEGLRVVLVRSD